MISDIDLYICCHHRSYYSYQIFGKNIFLLFYIFASNFFCDKSPPLRGIFCNINKRKGQICTKIYTKIMNYHSKYAALAGSKRGNYFRSNLVMDLINSLHPDFIVCSQYWLLKGGVHNYLIMWIIWNGIGT